jgi:hypothetical protein
MHVPLQLISPAWQVTTHTLLPHTDPAGQVSPAVPTPAVPHCPVAPQYWLLVVGSTQDPPQSISVCRHDVWHALPEQTSPAGHVMPTEPLPPVPHSPVAPQKVLLDVGSTQDPPQLTSTPGQEV